MRISPTCRLLAVSLALSVVAAPSHADSNADANALFVGAVLAWDQANAISDPSATAQSERLQLLRTVDSNLNQIISDHPGTDLAVQLVTGNSLGSISLPSARAALEEAEAVAAQASQWADCLNSPTPDCILAEAIRQAEETAATGGEPVGLATIISAQAAMGRLDDAHAMLPRLTTQTDRDYSQLDMLRAQIDAGDLTGATETLAEIVGDGAVGFALTSLATALFAADQTDQARLLVERAISVAQQNSSETSRARTLGDIGRVQSVAGRFDEAFATAGLIDDPESLDSLLLQIAWDQAKAGLFDEAEATLNGIGNPETLAVAQSRIAVTQADAGQPEEALQAARAIADGNQRAIALAAVARAEIVAGTDPAATLTEAHEALAGPSSGSYWYKANALNTLSITEIQAGLPDAARETFAAALAAAQETRGADSLIFILSGISSAQFKGGDPDFAAQALAIARVALNEPDEPFRVMNRFETLAMSQQVAGQPEAAQTWKDALALAETIPDDHYRISGLARLAETMALAAEMRAEHLAATP